MHYQHLTKGPLSKNPSSLKSVLYSIAAKGGLLEGVAMVKVSITGEFQCS